ncbi:SMP-30/gluconolactonase/LRE family protein [Geodermatophilus sp. CPCC 205761]|uniref:SMP-30/gluconolactonase/LRE family protein n=1 Tax=Geodermatophilus sp. CPCC 205761 TaxID=2936597 RepID=UPI003EEC6256
MSRSAFPRSSVRATVLVAATLGLGAATVAPAAAHPHDDVIVLPGATSAEGIAHGGGDTFYAGDLFAGDIFRGDLGRRTAELFIDAPDGRMAIGMFADLRHDLLFVAGGGAFPGGPSTSRGLGYVYDLCTGNTVAAYEFGDPGTSFVNDVTVTPDGAWFTDSLEPRLHFVPVRHGEPGTARTLELTGPAAERPTDISLNGIAATPDGDTLIVAHSGTGRVYTVDPGTGASAEIAGVDVPSVDGIQLEGHDLWAVQNQLNQVVRARLSPDLTSGSIEETITDDDFQIPTTLIVVDDDLAVVNAKFDTGIPPTADRYEVVLVER